MNSGQTEFSICNDYNAWAPFYDAERNLTRDIEAEAIRSVLAGVRCASAVEFGCGTGKNTGFLASLASKVLAFDFSEAMLQEARRTIAADNVAFHLADIERPWPLGGGSQDLVACSLILQHIRHLDFAFAEVGRVLADGGVLFVSELHPIKKYQGSKARYEIGGRSVEIAGFDHQISHYVRAARRAGLSLAEIDEWWHHEDQGRPPRLATFVFRKTRDWMASGLSAAAPSKSA